MIVDVVLNLIIFFVNDNCGVVIVGNFFSLVDSIVLIGINVGIMFVVCFFYCLVFVVWNNVLVMSRFIGVYV